MTEAPAELTARIEALGRVLDLGTGIISDETGTAARELEDHAAARLRHGTGFTVVALAGATGSGKSTLFNAIAGEDIATVGVTRPTTSEASAAVFGAGNAGPLLDWLGIKHRHGVTGHPELEGLVLIDLPDHDSVELSHRLQVDHFVARVDLLLWVMDPQKYADQALHQRYLSRLGSHSAVMAFLLHQADLAPAAEHPALRADAIRLLGEDGISDPTLLVTSAVSGLGLAEVRALLAERIEARNSALARIDADLRSLAADLQPLRTPPAHQDSRSARADLAAGLGDAAGAAAVRTAVGDGFRHDAALATGWPFTRWVKRLRRHPLRKLRPAPAARSANVPSAIPIDEPRLDLALKAYADRRAAGAPPQWARRLRAAAGSNRRGLVADLGSAVTSVAEAGTARPRWWSALGWLQRLLALITATGAGWLIVLLVLDWLRVPSDRITPEVAGWPLPTILLLGGAALGLLVAALGRGFAVLGGKRRGRRASKDIVAAIAEVADRQVVRPVDAEVERWAELADAVAVVAGESR